MHLVMLQMIREQIFLNFKKEIPYSSEVVVESFKEDDRAIRIQAKIVVLRDSQKGIVIGKKGAAVERVRVGSERTLREFFGKRVKLQLMVKVKKDWRIDEGALKQFGYVE